MSWEEYQKLSLSKKVRTITVLEIEYAPGYKKVYRKVGVAVNNIVTHMVNKHTIKLRDLDAAIPISPEYQNRMDRFGVSMVPAPTPNLTKFYKERKKSYEKRAKRRITRVVKKMMGV